MNKRGFFAISIIFSFFIVFLLILVMNLATYSQNRILLGQVKKDIKSTINLDVPKAKCIRMNHLDQSLDVGDKFVCDVNGDGVYKDSDGADSWDNEVFYFISSRYNTETLTFDADDNKDNYIAVLLASTKNYDSQYPISSLPKVTLSGFAFVNEWPNVRLYNTTRYITDENDNYVIDSNNEKYYFEYSKNGDDFAARLPSYKEILDFCKYCKNNPSYCSDIFSNDPTQLLLETVRSTPFGMLALHYDMNGEKCDLTSTSINSIRPVIEVPIKELKLR